MASFGRRFAFIPGAVIGAVLLFPDIRELLMDFGLEGEALGMWKGVCYTISVVLITYALCPDVRKYPQTLWHILFKKIRRGASIIELGRPQAGTDPEEIAQWQCEQQKVRQ